MQELDVPGILALHEGIIAREGGDGRILSEANIHQLVFHANLETDPLRRAALAFYILVAYPAFRQANESTACALAKKILHNGGYTLDPAGREALAGLAAGITAFEAGHEDIVAWFASHAGKEE